MGKQSRPAAALMFWKLSGPGAKFLAPLNPWWVVLETTGRRSGQPRRIPLARGPMVGTAMLLISVHGRRADWVRNIETNPRVRLQVGRRWQPATATVEPATPDRLALFNPYARNAAGAFAIPGEDPVLVRVETAAH